MEPTLGIQKVVNQDVMGPVTLERRVVEEIFMHRWPKAHVLLAEGANMAAEVGALLIRTTRISEYLTMAAGDSIDHRRHYFNTPRTSCSSRDTLLSFNLCTSAEAQPSSADAASRDTDFILKSVYRKRQGQKNSKINIKLKSGWGSAMESRTVTVVSVGGRGRGRGRGLSWQMAGRRIGKG